MDILIVRHGIAEERAASTRSGQDDADRELTKKGIERMKEAARGLRQCVDDIDLIATSPLIRARQTAEIVRKAYKPTQLLQIPELAPGQGPSMTTAWLQEQTDIGCVCLVGHEPDLSELIAWLTAGRAEGFAEFKKGAACLVRSAGPPERAGCSLVWLLSPRQLRLLANAE